MWWVTRLLPARWFAVMIVAGLLAAGPADQARPEPADQGASKLPVSVEQALYLIRSTLLTLNDANRSGNYTVLRDLAAPGFRAKNTAADLGVIFSDLRKRSIDMFAVALIGPQLTTAPHLDANKMLRLTGYFPTRPLQINFDLLYQNVEGHWMLYGISVATPQAKEVEKPPAPAQEPPPAPKRRPRLPKKN